MKSSLAAMVTACERFVANRRPAARLAFLITSDEEGQALEGTRYVMEQLTQRGEKIDYCVVGEPSSSERLGDTIRIGRRGSLSCKLLVKGIRGHVAYPHLARNPIHEALPVLFGSRKPTGTTAMSLFNQRAFKYPISMAELALITSSPIG